MKIVRCGVSSGGAFGLVHVLDYDDLRFRRHRVGVFYGAGGASWRGSNYARAQACGCAPDQGVRRLICAGVRRSRCSPDAIARRSDRSTPVRTHARSRAVERSQSSPCSDPGSAEVSAKKTARDRSWREVLHLGVAADLNLSPLVVKQLVLLLDCLSACRPPVRTWSPTPRPSGSPGWRATFAP